MDSDDNKQDLDDFNRSIIEKYKNKINLGSNKVEKTKIINKDVSAKIKKSHQVNDKKIKENNHKNISQNIKFIISKEQLLNRIKQSQINIQQKDNKIQAQNNPIDQIDSEMNSQQQQEIQKLFQNIEDYKIDQQINLQSIQKDKFRSPSSILRSNKQIKNKQRKSVTFLDNIQAKPVIYDQDRKWDQKIFNQRKGKFTPQQRTMLIKSLDQYRRVHNLSTQNLIELISGNNQEQIQLKQSHKRIWTIICSVLPDRSLRSSFKFLKRQLHKYNHQGNWKKQEQQNLLQLVQKYGRKWKQIAKQLKRTPQNIRDKYRQLGEQNNQRINNQYWTIQQLIYFLELIQKDSLQQFLNPDIKLQLQQANKHNKIQRQQILTRKYNSKNFLFHNINLIQKYINNQQFQKINQKNLHWNKIVQILGTKTISQCRNKFIQLLQITFKSSNKNIFIDQIIIKFIKRQNVKIQSQIQWNLWKNQQINSQQAQNRWKIMKKYVQGRSKKTFNDVLLKLQQRLGSKKNIIEQEK